MIMRLCKIGKLKWIDWKLLRECLFNLVCAYARLISCQCNCITSRLKDCAVLNVHYLGYNQKEKQQQPQHYYKAQQD